MLYVHRPEKPMIAIGRAKIDQSVERGHNSMAKSMEFNLRCTNPLIHWLLGDWNEILDK